MPASMKTFRHAGLALLALPCALHAADAVFRDDFEVLQFRGLSAVGMEMSYLSFNQANGPVADTDYAVYDTRVIDYFASKGVNAIRILCTWEALQPSLYSAVPYASVSNYQDYFDNYKRIVDYTTDVKHIRVIIEPWGTGADGNVGGGRWHGTVIGPSPGQVPPAAFADFWSKMAGNFKNNYLVSYSLIGEPNNQSTKDWFSAAQAAVTAIRNTGSTQWIFVPGTGYTAASSWLDNWYDTDAAPRSNADGWLNANGAGQPLTDPLDRMAVEVHTYLDCWEGGIYDEITANTAARDHVSVALDWAVANGLKIYLGELGIYAGNAPITNPDPINACPGGVLPAGATASAAWADFISYFNANKGPFMGYSWWAGGMPDWWNDVHAAHFSISPTNNATFTGDTVNMLMIQNDF
jgi:endoglucanase